MSTTRVALLPALALLLLTAVASVQGQRVSYEGYYLLQTLALDAPDGLRQVVAAGSRRGVQLLNEPAVGRPSVLVVAPHAVGDVAERLQSAGVDFTVANEDVQQLLDRVDQRTEEFPVLAQGNVTFDRFMTLDEIYAYLDTLAAKYPDVVQLQTIGQSTEGRDLRLVKLSTARSGSGDSKPAIFIDATIHAREWIAPCVALYTLQQLVENSTQNGALLEAVDWYILPVLNPDGYHYTHTTDRLWRKTRSYQGLEDPECVGVDANRNYDFHWGGEGSSDDPCTNTFAGQAPFSEPETTAHAAFLRAHNDTISLYLTLHSHGRLFLFPWGWTKDYPDNVDELRALGIAATQALEAVRGTNYTVGSSANVLYYSAGSSRDYAKGVPGARFSYTLELPEGGVSGFDPPPSDIWPVVTETFELVKVLGAAVGSQGPPSNVLNLRRSKFRLI